MKKQLEFKEVLGYFSDDNIVVLLNNSIIAQIYAHFYKTGDIVEETAYILKDNKINRLCLLRNRAITKNIPDEVVENAKKILSSNVLKIKDPEGIFDTN